jgi:flagella basal body P-ring formation protein FlgA
MKKILFFLIIFVFDINAKINQSSKESLVNFIHKLVDGKIATQNFLIKINAISQNVQDSDLESLKDDSVENLEISSDQRNFSLILNGKNVSGKIEWQTEIPVLNTALGSDEIIQNHHLVMQTFPTDVLLLNQVIKKEELLGKAVKNIIKPYQPVDKAQIKLPLLVKKDDYTQIKFFGNNILITANAKAQSDGVYGDTIPFKIINKEDKNQKIFYATVSGLRQAEIRQEGIS